MAKTFNCLDCGDPLPPALPGRGGHNRIRCDKCRVEAKNQSRRELYYRQKAGKEVKIIHRPPIAVYYPDVALPDYWTRTDYERYKHALPEGAKIEFR